ncbi:hypothetical protein WKI13_00680 [Teredinibacter turnerae]|uniref:hypothetical protein n=1 Tax=Teredinibacter turnerae TaxID=2426 RepID=UPI000377CAFF|nr:hypothetical protein [Teredinibacter turnerae]
MLRKIALGLGLLLTVFLSYIKGNSDGYEKALEVSEEHWTTKISQLDAVLRHQNLAFMDASFEQLKRIETGALVEEEIEVLHSITDAYWELFEQSLESEYLTDEFTGIYTNYYPEIMKSSK